MENDLKDQLEKLAVSEERSLSRTIIRLIQQALQSSDNEAA